MLRHHKLRANEILDKASEGDRASRVIDSFIMALIVLNVGMVILETVRDLAESYATFFAAFELVSVGIFTLEYLLRLWACTSDEKFRGPMSGLSRWASVIPRGRFGRCTT